MVAVHENDITRALGAADAYELLSLAFAYPDSDLAEALVNGTFLADLTGCLSDMGVGEEPVDELCGRIERAVADRDAEELLEAMRVEYTSLYYGLGKFRKISPYESAFKKLEANPDARATVFLTKSTHDVERAMKSRGALPPNARREPADFLATELDFVRHLFTGYAASSAEDEGADSWKEDTERFFDNHVLNWIPSLFEKTGELSDLALYRELADVGLLVLEHTKDCLNV